MNKICKIYVIRNNINDKLYIGQTWRSLKLRIKEHKSKNSPCIKLYNAIKKYDFNNFSVIKIAIAFNQKDANKLEQYFIKKFDSINKGYNIRYGGSNGALSNDTRKKISEKLKGDKNPMYNIRGEKHFLFGTKLSKERKEKLKKAVSGNKNHMYGKKHSEKTKKILSEKLKGDKNPMYGKKHSINARQKIIKHSKFKTLKKIKNKTIGFISFSKIHNLYRIRASAFNKKYCRYRKTEEEAIIALNELREELKKKYIKEEI